jgi:hypothetical protein
MDTGQSWTGRPVVRLVRAQAWARRSHHLPLIVNIEHAYCTRVRVQAVQCPIPSYLYTLLYVEL